MIDSFLGFSSLNYYSQNIQVYPNQWVTVKWFVPILVCKRLGWLTMPLMSISMIAFENSSQFRYPPFEYFQNKALNSYSLKLHPNLSKPLLNSSNPICLLSPRSKQNKAFLPVFHSLVLPSLFRRIFSKRVCYSCLNCFSETKVSEFFRFQVFTISCSKS